MYWNFNPLHYPFSSSVLFWNLCLKLSAGIFWHHFWRCLQRWELEQLHRRPPLIHGVPNSLGCWGHQQTSVPCHCSHSGDECSCSTEGISNSDCLRLDNLLKLFLFPQLMNWNVGIGSFKTKNLYWCFYAGLCDNLKRQLYEYLGHSLSSYFETAV